MAGEVRECQSLPPPHPLQGGSLLGRSSQPPVKPRCPAVGLVLWPVSLHLTPFLIKPSPLPDHPSLCPHIQAPPGILTPSSSSTSLSTQVSSPPDCSFQHLPGVSAAFLSPHCGRVTVHRLTQQMLFQHLIQVSITEAALWVAHSCIQIIPLLLQSTAIPQILQLESVSFELRL